MTITAVTYERIGDVTRVFATSDLVGAIFYHWYLDGAWLGATSSPWRDVQLAPGDQARLDVADTTDTGYDPIANAPPGYPARRSLWWVRSADADVAFYLVEQKREAADYETVGRVVQGETWTLGWVSARLDDLTTYTWRVTPYDAAGNAGTARVFGPEKIVRRPDAPVFDVAFSDETKWVTFAEEDAVAAPVPTYSHTLFLRRRVAEAVDVSVPDARAFRVLPPVEPPPQPVDNMSIYARRRVTEAADVWVPDSAFRSRLIPPFSPLSIPGLGMWLKPADLTTVTKDGSNLISQINDKSGLGRHMGASGTARPTWVSSAMDFDGAANRLTPVAGSGVCPFTGQSGEIWVVVEFDATNTQVIAGAAQNPGNNNRIECGVTSSRFRFVSTFSGTDVMQGPATVATATRYVLRFASSGSAWSLEANGSVVTIGAGSGSNNGDWFGDNSPTALLAIGSQGAATAEFLNGRISEFVVFDGVTLTADQAALMRTYLA